MPIPDYTDADFQERFQDHLPSGAIWPRDSDSVQAQVSLALMRQYTRLHARSVDLLLDAFPVAPVELLPEWEETLGLPDPCAGESPTIELRQQQVAARFVAAGGQSVPYFTAVAAALGYSITITEFAPARADFTRADDPCNDPSAAFVWQVNAPGITVSFALADEADADDAVETVGNTVLLCELRRLKPAHTLLDFLLGTTLIVDTVPSPLPSAPPSSPPTVTGPSISITAVSLGTVTPSALVPLMAVGNQFIDASGNTVRLRAIAWYGYDGPDLIVHGLYAGRGYKSMLDQISALGFNCVRIVFADDMVTSSVTFSSTAGNQYVDPANNPDIIGLTPLQALDAIVYYGASIGLRFILDHHRLSITSIGPEDSGYGTDGWPAANPETGTYLYGGSATPRAYTPEGNWRSLWVALATHFTSDQSVPGITGAGQYASNANLRAAICGWEPHNEPHNPTWSTWAGMVEVLHPYVHAIAPDWVCFVQGVGGSDDGSDTYWWGGYLKGVASRPVSLRDSAGNAISGKLAYSPHDYGQSVSPQNWLSSVATAGGTTTSSGGAQTGIYPALPARTVTAYPSNLQAVFDAYWGYIFINGLAPILLGEFGIGGGIDYATGAADPLQVNGALELQWAGALVSYLNGGRNDGTSLLSGTQAGMSFSYFALNPESGNPLGGLLENSDYETVQSGKMSVILPLLSQQA